MNETFDELAKVLAEDVSRREALRRVGSVLATALLASVGLKTAWGACPRGKTLCSGKCVNLQTDDKNCGSCGTVCPSGQSCVNGTCTSGGGGGCPSGQTRCKGKCVNLTTDPNNCGGCGSQCPSDQVCSGGACQCPIGKAQCNGACVDTGSDPSNCGTCGHVCATGTTCVSGFCQSGACSPACPSGFICSSIGTCCIPNGGTVPADAVANCCTGVAVCSGDICTCGCLGLQASCTFDEQCCIGTCNNGVCCRGAGESCAEHGDAECCSGFCGQGVVCA